MNQEDFNPDYLDYHPDESALPMEQRIIRCAKRLGLPVALDTTTPGDGNCFYRAVIQQLSRSDIRPHIAENFREINQSELRCSVCEFVKENLRCPLICRYKEIYEETLHKQFNNMTWEEFIADQQKNGSYATELFILATALFLQVNIKITSKHCTVSKPFNVIPAVFSENGNLEAYPSLVLGNISDIHFQSLLPIASQSATDTDIVLSIVSIASSTASPVAMATAASTVSFTRASYVTDTATTSTTNIAAPRANSRATSTSNAMATSLATETAAPYATETAIPSGTEIAAPSAIVRATSRATGIAASTDIATAAPSATETTTPSATEGATPSRRQQITERVHVLSKISEMRGIALMDMSTSVNHLGKMDVVCRHCSSLSFKDELFKCCHNGKVMFKASLPYPETLKSLLSGKQKAAKNFQRHIRAYNNSFGFASMGANITTFTRGPPCFKICGKVCHRVGTLHPCAGRPPQYSQLYIVEPSTSIDQRLMQPSNEKCLSEVIRDIDTVLHQINPYAAAYKNMVEVDKEQQRRNEELGESHSVTMYLRKGNDRRRYNAPQHEEVAAVFTGEEGAPPMTWDLAIYPRDHPLQHIPFTSSHCDPMVYPILFPHGDPGWTSGVPHMQEHRSPVRNTVTMLQHYTYMLAVRDGIFNPIHHARKLLQQFIVDAYVKIESHRLQFLQKNQSQLRVEQYCGLVDHLRRKADSLQCKLGRMVILPSSFQGSPRAMIQHYQDAMAIVSKFGKPDLFLTFTCNPKWPEIQEQLEYQEKVFDRPDIVARVFNMKLKNLLNDILKNHVLGEVVAYVRVIEFQKRSLPHCHMLLHMSEEWKMRDGHDIDRVISAEIPDKASHPLLHEDVRSFMLHGPCGSDKPSNVCMEDNVCTKKFPKNFSQSTIVSTEGYPVYKRPNNGRTVDVKGVKLDNRYVVPYNPWLLSKYEAHINLEACFSIKSIKYIIKYVHKGHDCAHIEIRETYNHDEISMFVDARYVSAPEAAWRMFEFRLHDQSHTVIRLPVHLEDFQSVYFHHGEEETVINDDQKHETALLAWFKLNEADPLANSLRYTEIPLHYVYNQKNREWKLRQRNASKVIARLYSVSPRDIERFHLRLLLLHCPGAKSYNDLRTIGDVVTTTFKEACLLRGLLQDDGEWDRVITEAAAYQMPKQLREMFAFVLMFCNPMKPEDLWKDHQDSLMEDFLKSMPSDVAEKAALWEIKLILRETGLSLKQFGLPEVSFQPDIISSYQAEATHVTDVDRSCQLRDSLTEEQATVANAVLEAAQNTSHSGDSVPNAFYVDGPGGSGKTYLYNHLIREVKFLGLQVSSCAWTGIAATLLDGGQTMHSLFKLPVPIVENSTCNVSLQSDRAHLLRRQSLFIIDEASMIPGAALHAVDRFLKDLMGNSTLFGGKVILLGGDFRQVLPVVRHGKPADIVEACLKRSTLWFKLEKFTLTGNMRVTSDATEFRNWLLELGNGSLPLKETEPFQGSVEIPNQCVTKSVIRSIFQDTVTEDDFKSRIILCPTNEDTFIINSKVLEGIPGEVKVYTSSDEIVSDDDEERTRYPTEFLHSLTPSGMPPHTLPLKIGVPIMLMRNLSLKLGLCNGTRLIVRKMLENCICAEVINGNAAGKLVFIPRIQLCPSDTTLPFAFQRRQIPVRLAFSMTINKAQGQTFERVGIFLKNSCFAHGQLYVAFSRAKDFTQVYLEAAKTASQGFHNGKLFTPNKVFKEVLN